MASIAHLAAGAACGAVYARRTKQSPVRPMVAFAVLAVASEDEGDSRLTTSPTLDEPSDDEPNPPSPQKPGLRLVTD